LFDRKPGMESHDDTSNTRHNNPGSSAAGKVVIAGECQVTQGSEVLKAGANKLRLLHKDKILAGFRRLHL